MLFTARLNLDWTVCNIGYLTSGKVSLNVTIRDAGEKQFVPIFTFNVLFIEFV